MPIDPVDTDSRDLRPNLPDFLDENPTRDLIMEGMEVSESERRDAAAEVYGEDPSLPVSDDTDDETDEIAPEVAAMHEKRIP
jgi:hypothetical protein